jgi:hypothetical protein
MAKAIDPAVAFERLFGDATQAAAAKERLSRRQSILDFVLEDSKSLENRLGASDRRKLDQFQTSVREIELRIDRARKEQSPVKVPDYPVPAGIPHKVGEHIDLMYDMLLLAFQTDSTRISTLMLAVDGSNRAFPEIDIKDGHHHLSHHQNNQEMIEKIRRIDRFYVERFARFIKRTGGPEARQRAARTAPHPPGRPSLGENEDPTHDGHGQQQPGDRMSHCIAGLPEVHQSQRFVLRVRHRHPSSLKTHSQLRYHSATG